MATSAIPAQTAHAPRIQSVDALRGAIMMIMAIDHIRDYIARSAMEFSPTDLSRTTVAIFFTRWFTHFCAPVFILTAGIGAFLWMTRGHHSKSELSTFLVARGLWLIFLELTVLRFIMFSQVSWHGSLVILLILWAIGLSMIALAGLVYLPMWFLITVSAAIVVFHNFLDNVSSESFGSAAWFWDILHQQGVFTWHAINFLTAYPVLPWIGVMAAGYCLGGVFDWEVRKRRRLLFCLGAALTAAFLILRAVDLYGDPARWTHQPSPWFTVLSFLNTTKYPPSLDFVLMTLGPALVCMSWLERFRFSSANPLIVFGRVPFFYYVAHLAVAHAIAITVNFVRYGRASFLLVAPPSMGGARELFPAGFGFPLWTVYAVWVLVLLMLYPACLWFSRLKQRRHDWWLSFL